MHLLRNSPREMERNWSPASPATPVNKYIHRLIFKINTITIKKLCYIRTKILKLNSDN